MAIPDKLRAARNYQICLDMFELIYGKKDPHCLEIERLLYVSKSFPQ
jgi:hypothetical protein